MRTARRLSEVYLQSQNLLFDDDSKMIFFSDIHRGDNSLTDNFAHNQNIYYHALRRYYDEGFTYFQLGDGAELWEQNHLEVIINAHSQMYQLLHQFYEKDRFFMLFGNHDKVMSNPKWVEENLHDYKDEFLEEQGPLFPGLKVKESMTLQYKKTGQKLLLVHGHQGDLLNDKLWPVSMVSIRFFWKYLHVVGFQNPTSPVKNRNRRHRIESNFSKWIDDTGVGIICGHTHRMKLPGPYDTPYFNTGCCIHPRGINGIEIENGKISLIDWTIISKEDGDLMIERKVIRGPFAIEDYVGIKPRKIKKR